MKAFMLVILYRPVLTLSLPILYMYVDFWVFWRTRSTMLRPASNTENADGHF